MQGLFTLAPIALTLALILWLFQFADSILKRPLELILGHDLYFPGLGVIIMVITIFMVGLLVNYWLSRLIYEAFEKLISKIPLIKTLYSSLKDLLSFFGRKEDNLSLVVEVEFGEFRLIGFLTDRQPKHPIGKEGEVVVYFPMSYQIGGYTIILPKERVKPVNMTIEQAMNYILTAGALNKN
ncbi:MAG: DUF502 domain-containing protein [Chlamydiia bacterium]